MPTFNTTIGEGIELDVEIFFKVSGKYHPATLEDPEELPDYELEEVNIKTEDGEKNIIEILTDDVILQLQTECEEYEDV